LIDWCDSFKGWFRGLERYLIAGIACLLLAVAIPMTLGRYYLIQGGLWINALSIMPEAWPQVQNSLRQSLRWDPANPHVWLDLARLEYYLSFSRSPRLPYAVRAQQTASALAPNRKSYLKTLNEFRFKAPSYEP